MGIFKTIFCIWYTLCDTCDHPNERELMTHKLEIMGQPKP